MIYDIRDVMIVRFRRCEARYKLLTDAMRESSPGGRCTVTVSYIHEDSKDSVNFMDIRCRPRSSKSTIVMMTKVMTITR